MSKKSNGKSGKMTLIGQPPKGFRAVAVSSGLGTTHDFEKEPVVQGLVVSIQENVGKNEQSVMNIKTDKGLRSVWFAKQLEGLFAEAKPGKSQVYIQYEGKTKIKGRKHPMKNFAAFIK